MDIPGCSQLPIKDAISEGAKRSLTFEDFRQQFMMADSKYQNLQNQVEALKWVYVVKVIKQFELEKMFPIQEMSGFENFIKFKGHFLELLEKFPENMNVDDVAMFVQGLKQKLKGQIPSNGINVQHGNLIEGSKDIRVLHNNGTVDKRVSRVSATPFERYAMDFNARLSKEKMQFYQWLQGRVRPKQQTIDQNYPDKTFLDFMNEMKDENFLSNDTATKEQPLYNQLLKEFNASMKKQKSGSSGTGTPVSQVPPKNFTNIAEEKKNKDTTSMKEKSAKQIVNKQPGAKSKKSKLYSPKKYAASTSGPTLKDCRKTR